MGEIAKLIIDGAMCSWCGINFEEENGFPVLCGDCFKDVLKKYGSEKNILDKFGLQKTLVAEI